MSPPGGTGGDRLPAAVPWLVGIGLVALAWSSRFLQDDAFISFRYARNLAEGLGLVWQPGVAVEGYSNFLWTALLGLGIRLGLDPVGLSMGLGLGGYALTLAATARLARRVLGSERLALLAVLALGLNPTVRGYATGGLATSWQTALNVLVMERLLAGLEAGYSRRDLVRLGTLAAAALLLRPDAGLLVGLSTGTLLVCLRRRQRGRQVGYFLLPLALVVAPWLLFKLHAYGHLLPNTAFAKLPPEAPWAAGLGYLGQFLQSTWTLPFPLLFLALLPRALAPAQWRLRPLLLLTVPWLGFLVRAGGDFMEFRMLVPVMPFLVILGVWVLDQVGRGRRGVRLALAGLVVAGNCNHEWNFADAPYRRGVETFAELTEHLYGPRYGWVSVGRALRAHFPGPGAPTLASAACGAIPFYSRLDTVDQLGLNDAWVARHGVPFSQVAGHRRVAPLGYLVARGVDLVLSHPVLFPLQDVQGGLRRQHLEGPFFFLPDPEHLPPGAALLFVPIDLDRVLPVIQLTRHPRVEAAARTGRWLRVPLDEIARSP